MQFRCAGMEFGLLLDQGQTQAGAGGPMTLDEAVEGGREERYGDAGAIVIDGDLDSVGAVAGRDRDGVRVTVLYGVGDRLVTMSMSPPGRPVTVVRGHSVRSATPDGPTARAG